MLSVKIHSNDIMLHYANIMYIEKKKEREKTSSYVKIEGRKMSQ